MVKLNLGVGAHTKISTEFAFGGHSPQGARLPKMWRWVTTLGKSAQAVWFGAEFLGCYTPPDIVVGELRFYRVYVFYLTIYLIFSSAARISPVSPPLPKIH